MLSPEASAEPGQWSTDRVPPLRGIMDAFSDPEVETVTLMKSAQVGGTEFILNVIGYHIDQDPAPMLVLQPTLEMGQTFSKDRLAPMLRDTPCLRGKVRDAKTRNSGNTLLHKTFPGGHITICGANSPAGLASRPIRIVLCDEVDRYPPSAGTEGDPVNLAFKRSTTFWNRKRALISTPTIKGLSRIEASYEESDRRRFWVPCPECGEPQVLRWAQVRWEPNKPETAWYECEHCRARWDDAKRWEAIRHGQWRAEGEFRGHAGFHIWEAYSPWVRLSEIVEAFLEAKKRPETLQTWVNTSLGETWEEQGDEVDGHELQERCEPWDPDVLPERVVVLTAGADVQDERIEVEVVGWGRDEESWSIAWETLWGDPRKPAVWQDLDRFLKRRWDHSLEGVRLGIAAALIDSGHLPKEVHRFTRGKAGRRIFACRGSSEPGKPLLAGMSRRNGPRVPVYYIGTDTAKGTILARLKIEEPGPGYMHFPVGRDREYFEQLTAERAVRRYRKGRPYREWIKKRARNEALDCRVYAMAALEQLNANLDKLAAQLERQVETVRQQDRETIEAAEAAGVTVEAVAAAQKKAKAGGTRRRRSGWATGWRR